MGNPHYISKSSVKNNNNNNKDLKGIHSRQVGYRVEIALFWQLQICSLTKTWGKLTSATTGRSRTALPKPRLASDENPILCIFSHHSTSVYPLQLDLPETCKPYELFTQQLCSKHTGHSLAGTLRTSVLTKRQQGGKRKGSMQNAPLPILIVQYSLLRLA